MGTQAPAWKEALLLGKEPDWPQRKKPQNMDQRQAQLYTKALEVSG